MKKPAKSRKERITFTATVRDVAGVKTTQRDIADDLRFALDEKFPGMRIHSPRAIEIEELEER